jgi:uncharacterized protein (DUF1800 family)
MKSLLLCALASAFGMSAFALPAYQMSSETIFSGMSPSQAVPTVTHDTAPQQIAPKSVYVHIGQTQTFVSAGATAWSTSFGKVTPAGVYYAPVTLPANPVLTVTAVGPGGSATATVVLVSGALQTIAPATISLALGAKQQYVSPAATSWSAAYGTISSGGLYTAPTEWPASGSDTIYVSGGHGSAAAQVTLIPPVPKITAVSGGGQLTLGLFTVSVNGTGLISASVAKINGILYGSTYANGLLNITGFISKPGPGMLTITNRNFESNAVPVYVGVQNPKVSPAAARRFLEQAAFGPSPTDAERVQMLGFQPWIQEQFNLKTISSYTGVAQANGGMPEQFLTNAVNDPDQLRQRVAFALSQIFVTSLEKIGSNKNMVSYQDMLLSDAFTNYRTIMQAVTCSPAMGEYLDMANNAQANPATGSEANQNYARELMQLFTIGTNMLNQDGTVQLDSNQLPIPTYSQFNVTEFARVFTGWTYAPPPGSVVVWNSGVTSFGSLAPYPAQHDSGSKQLLNNHVAAAGLTPTADLEGALDNIFQHPNVGPFVSTQLIQHLVKSNPSPAYVSRVAAVFNNNGSHVRGDMKSVISAILLDPEARANDEGGEDKPADGHLQEPALFIAGMVRAFGGQMNPQNYYHYDMANMGQDIFSSPSVFNYYAPNYGVQGTSLEGGEFQIFSPNNAILRANEVSYLFSQWSNPVETYGPGTSVNLTAYLPFGPYPAQLVSALDLTLTHGTMPTEMRQAIVNAVTGETGGSLRRVERATYLILTSNYYNVWH